MKVEYTDKVTTEKSYTRGSYVYKYTIKDAILKTHFKLLMKMSWNSYDATTKTGHILSDYRNEFLELIAKIEKSNDKRCQMSYKKAKESYRNKTSCNHDDLGSVGHKHGESVRCPLCGCKAEVW